MNYIFISTHVRHIRYQGHYLSTILNNILSLVSKVYQNSSKFASNTTSDWLNPLPHNAAF